MVETSPNIVVVPAPSSSGKHTGVIVAGVGALVVAGAGTYAYFQYQAYVKNGGTMTMLQWIEAGMPTSDSGKNPTTYTPTITVSPANITYTLNSLTGPTYSTAVITITGKGFASLDTISLPVTMTGLNHVYIGTITADASGNFTSVIQLVQGIGGVSAATTIAAYTNITATGATAGAAPSVNTTWTNTAGGYTVDPQISINKTSFSYPNDTVCIQGTGFTKGSMMKLYDSHGGISTQTVAADGSFSTSNFSIQTMGNPVINTETETSPLTITIYGVDSSGVKSNTLLMTVSWTVVSSAEFQLGSPSWSISGNYINITIPGSVSSAFGLNYIDVVWGDGYQNDYYAGGYIFPMQHAYTSDYSGKTIVINMIAYSNTTTYDALTQKITITAPTISAPPTNVLGQVSTNPYLPNNDGTLPTPPSVVNPANGGLYWYLVSSNVGPQELTAAYVSAYNATVNSGGSATYTIKGGYTFMYFAGPSSNTGSFGNPYEAWQGYVGVGYYWYVALGLECQSQITSQTMFNAVNTAVNT